MPKKNPNRMQRVADLIRTTLASLLQENMKEIMSSMVTITGVNVSPDFSHARVYVSVLDADKAKETVAALNQESKNLRYLLAQSVDLRMTPALKFFYDDSLVRGSHISALINQAVKKSSSHE